MHQHRMDGFSEQGRSELMVGSYVDSRAGEKRRLEDREVSESTRPVHPTVHSSPQQQRKIARREGYTDIASAKGMGVKTVARVRPSGNKEEDEEEIGDEALDVPPPSRLSSQERISDVHVVDPFTSIRYATWSPAGGSRAVDSALMARIYAQGKSTTSTSYSQPARTPFPPPANPAKENGIAASSSVLATSLPKTMQELAQQHVKHDNTADVPMREVEQTRFKGVIGLSGNQTTVNGLAIPTGKKHGENQLDEAGQRELIAIIVELHNKGISIEELAQLVNSVMTALAKPAPLPESKLVTHSANSLSAVPTSVAFSVPPESAAPSTSAVAVNSRRLGATDFVDLPPSRLASSSFFRSNVRRTFTPHHTKQMVASLNDSSDDGPDSGEMCKRGFSMGTMSTESGVIETLGPVISVVDVNDGVTNGAGAAALPEVPAATPSSVIKTPLHATAGLAPSPPESEPIPTLKNQGRVLPPPMPISLSTANADAPSGNLAHDEGTTSNMAKSYREAKKKAKKAASLGIMREKLAAGEWDAFKQEKREKREKEDEDKRRAKQEEKARKARQADEKRTPSHTRPRWNQAPAPTATRQESRFQHAGMTQSTAFAPSVIPTNAPTVSTTSITSQFTGLRQANAGRECKGPPAPVASYNGPPRAVSAKFAHNTAPRFRPANGGHGWNGPSTSVASANASPPVNSWATSTHARPAAGTAPNPRHFNNLGRAWNREPRREG